MNNNIDRIVRKVVIDPGHGGTDSGATGNNLLEKDYNLLISKYMYDRFKQLGVPVAITRDSDTTLSPTDRVNTILSKFGNSSDVILISNHVNSGGANGKNVGKVSSVLFTIEVKEFWFNAKVLFLRVSLKSLFRS